MYNRSIVWVLLVLVSACGMPALAQTKYQVASPDKKVIVSFFVQGQKPCYQVSVAGRPVILASPMGLVTTTVDLSQGLTLREIAAPRVVSDRYTMKNAKRAQISVVATERSFVLSHAKGQQLEIIFRVSDDGVAFRYRLPAGNGPCRISEEASSFRFPPGTRAWLQPLAEAKTGWEQTNPSYEEEYLKDIPAGTAAPGSAGWAFPALFKTGDAWVLLSEAGLDRQYSATRLQQLSPANTYRIGFPQPAEVLVKGAVPGPEVSAFPWQTPWRIIAAGTLKTLVESTLGTDMAKPAISIDTAIVRPGQAAWSWAIYKDDSTVYQAQRRFIDYAADMHWEYCLIDALWDKQIGYEKVRELAAYAATRKVGLLLWYNSAGSWNTVNITPKDKLLTREQRRKEFALLKEMGISGVKIDFFGGDDQSMIGYYLDILDDAAGYGLLVNFHGCTLPRGWQRTYPHLMTMEAIRGFEFITFNQANANEEAAHAATIPFTRNIFDPMDFTPLSLHRIPNIERKTTAAFELALTVVFLSGIQHFAETPEGLEHVPGFIKDYLRQLPGWWEETRFIDGYPGRYFVVARRSGNRWYIAGINGEQQPRSLPLDLSFLPAGQQLVMLHDGAAAGAFSRSEVSVPASRQLQVQLPAGGGVVLVTE